MFIKICGSFFFALTLLGSMYADPLSSTDLGSKTEWSYKKERGDSWQNIAVPGQLSVKDTPDKWIDYKRQITIPRAATRQATELRLLSINDGGEVYLDEKRVATVTYGLFPVRIDLTPFVEPGQVHTLMLRCFSRQHCYQGGAFPQDHNGEELLGVPRGVFQQRAGYGQRLHCQRRYPDAGHRRDERHRRRREPQPRCDSYPGLERNDGHLAGNGERPDRQRRSARGGYLRRHRRYLR